MLLHFHDQLFSIRPCKFKRMQYFWKFVVSFKMHVENGTNDLFNLSGICHKIIIDWSLFQFGGKGKWIWSKTQLLDGKFLVNSNPGRKLYRELEKLFYIS